MNLDRSDRVRISKKNSNLTDRAEQGLRGVDNEVLLIMAGVFLTKFWRVTDGQTDGHPCHS